ncbi:MAG: cysteine synthase family protein [Actinobacteria bacterium]|nr:cysteine synthase family protein [Actinomycetota bacterium]
MPGMRSNVLAAVGNTPMIRLERVVPQGHARVLVKLESANPTGSMKDRMAIAAIEAAIADRRLAQRGTVVEYTAGTTGISLGLVCAARGLRLEIVFSDAFSEEKRRMMESFGAHVTDVPSGGEGITEALIKEMIATSEQIAARPGHWWCDQLTNHDAIAGYLPLGEEIWEQTDGEVDVFVHSVGTAHSIHGVAKALWGHSKDIRIVAVEPASSAVLSGGATGSHKIEGIGIGFIPPLWEPDLVDEIQTISTEEAWAMARRLAAEEGIFAGASSGANVAVALRVAERLGPNGTVVTLVVDSGLRYVSTDLYATRGSRDAV